MSYKGDFCTSLENVVPVAKVNKTIYSRYDPHNSDLTMSSFLND